jgi:hypothetical protein
VVCELDGMHGEHRDSAGDDSRCARDNSRMVNQPLARDDGVVRGFSGIQGETTVRKHMGSTLWLFANRDGGNDGDSASVNSRFDTYRTRLHNILVRWHVFLDLGMKMR